jgi:serine/threonine protein phosphatase PrpC
LYVQGPLRVFPGRLSVSRTFGDIEAKRAKYGGNANVIVCEPEIKVFKLKENFDFFLIGCDGIFERLDNKQCIDAVWRRIQDQVTNKTYDMISPQSNASSKHGRKAGVPNAPFHYDEHTAAAEGVEIVLREAAASRSLDNITVVLLGLKNLKKSIKKLFDGQTLSQVR